MIVRICLILGLTILGFATETFSSEKQRTAREILTQPSSGGNFSFELHKFFQARKQEASKEKLNSQKSIGKAVLFSAALPGSGQIYSGSYIKGIAFLVVEVAALTGHFHFQSRGNNLESQFEADANQLWSETAYWNWMSEVSSIDRSNFGTDQEWIDALRNYERGRFSHFLPERKNQQYYENIGKYNQFIIGWQDFREGILPAEGGTFTLDDYDNGRLNNKDLLTISPQRNAYTELRKDSNDNFKRATTLVTVALFNHLISAVDAGLTTKKLNQRIQASFNIRGMIYETEIVPVLKLGIAW